MYRKGQRFTVRREFTARGEDGDVQCLSLGDETGDYLIPCVDRDDVDLEDVTADCCPKCGSCEPLLPPIKGERMTKQEQIELRDMTYEGPIVPPLRCENCKHGWFEHGSNQCHAVEVRGELKIKKVHPLGFCNLYERKPTA